MRDLLRFYFSFDGRATRYDFNIRYALVLFVGSLLASAVDIAIAKGDLQAAMVLPHVTFLWNILIIPPTLAVMARRLHDVNLSGWWQMPFHALAVFAVFYFEIYETDFEQGQFSLSFMVLLLVILIAYLVMLVFFSTKRGTIGPNKYGADPLVEGTHV